MMNNITFEPLKDTDLQYACQLYEEAFPIEERRDTSEWLLQNKQNPLFNILCIKQDQTFQGILSYWTFESFHYIEHFAISAQQRGNGIGCAALELFVTTRMQYPIILEVEPDVNDTTHRRILFYKKHRFYIIEHPYLQPSYHKGGSPFPLNIMCNDVNFANHNFNNIVRTIHQQVYHYIK